MWNQGERTGESPAFISALPFILSPSCAASCSTYSCLPRCFAPTPSSPPCSLTCSLTFRSFPGSSLGSFHVPQLCQCPLRLLSTHNSSLSLFLIPQLTLTLNSCLSSLLALSSSFNPQSLSVQHLTPNLTAHPWSHCLSPDHPLSPARSPSPPLASRPRSAPLAAPRD